MSLFASRQLNSPRDLLLDQLRDLYDGETRLARALPRMAEAAHSLELQGAFRDHFQRTLAHVSRLKAVFEKLDEDPAGQTCEAMKSLIQEAEIIVRAKGNKAVKDAGLIAAVQHVVHYEIASYRTARAFAEPLGHEEIARALERTREEETRAYERLSEIADQTINLRAAGKTPRFAPRIRAS